jgi:cell division protein FtsL
MEADAAMEEMTEKKDQQPVRLNLRRLEHIQRLLQYGAVAVFLVFLGLITFSYFQWRKIEQQIAGQRETLKQQQQEIKQNEEKIEGQKAVLDSLSKYVRDSPAKTPAQEEEKKRIIELSIPQNANARQLPPRVYFQIAREDQRRRAAEVARQLQANGYLVPGIENVGKKANGPTELRYCSSDDTWKKDVDGITDLLVKLSVKVKPQLIRNCGNVRPRHYEVWFGDDY